MIRSIPFLCEEGIDLCMALTVEKEMAVTFDILWYEMLVINLSEKYMPQIWIEIGHSKSTMLIPNSYKIQDKREFTRKDEAILLSLEPFERCIIRFGLCILADNRESVISVFCKATMNGLFHYSNEVFTKIIATVGKPCLIKQSLLLPKQIPDSVVIKDIKVYFQHQKSTYLPFSKKGSQGELCHHTELLMSGVLSYTLKVEYHIKNVPYEHGIEYITGYTDVAYLSEGVRYIKPNIKLVLYPTDYICIDRKVYCCTFAMLFFLP